jgi:hypothetical protein
VNTNLVSRVLAVIGVVTLSATAAHAGHGQGGGGTQVQGYECYSASGEHEGAVVDVIGNGTTPVDTAFADQPQVGITQGQTICVSVSVNLVSRSNGVTTFNALPTTSNDSVLKCYNMAQVTAANPGVVVQVTDGVDIETLKLNGVPKSLCLPGAISK